MDFYVWKMNLKYCSTRNSLKASPVWSDHKFCHRSRKKHSQDPKCHVLACILAGWLSNITQKWLLPLSSSMLILKSCSFRVVVVIIYQQNKKQDFKTWSNQSSFSQDWQSQDWQVGGAHLDPELKVPGKFICLLHFHIGNLWKILWLTCKKSWFEFVFIVNKGNLWLEVRSMAPHHSCITQCHAAVKIKSSSAVWLHFKQS